jgi:hypothetical protein
MAHDFINDDSAAAAAGAEASVLEDILELSVLTI